MTIAGEFANQQVIEAETKAAGDAADDHPNLLGDRTARRQRSRGT